VYDDALNLSLALNKATELRAQLKERKQHAGQSPSASAIEEFSKKLDAVAGEGGGRRGRGAPQTDSLASVRGSLLTLMGILQDADVAPTSQTVTSIGEVEKKVPVVLQNWEIFQKQEITVFNQQLKAANLQQVNIN
jgi:hypothetical protein